MDATMFVVKYFVYGLCLGEAVYLATWFWSKAISWIADAYSGHLK